MIREQDSGSVSVLKLEKKVFDSPPHTHTHGGGRLWVICELKFLRLNDLEFLFLCGSRTVGNRKWLKQTKASLEEGHWRLCVLAKQRQFQANGICT